MWILKGIYVILV